MLRRRLQGTTPAAQAIGADRATVFRLIVGGGLKLALVGVLIGIAGALSLTRVVASMLFEITPYDLASYGASVGLVLTVAALASYVPARRAMEVDPVLALRQE